MSGFIRQAFEKRARVVSGLTLEEAFRHGAQQSITGRYVSAETSLQVATVYRCVRVLSDNIAQLPLKVYRRDSAGQRQEARDHPLWRLFHKRPNRLMTPFVWKQTLFSSLFLRGNGYGEIEYGGDGWPAAIWPLQADGMNARLERRKPVYQYSASIEDAASSNGLLPGYRVHHVRSLSNDGFLGRSVVRQAMHTLELALVAEEFGARFFGQGATPGVALMHPDALSTEALERIRKSWDERHGGVGKSHKTAVLEEGMTVEKIGIPPEEAQFLETRRFQSLEICRWFGVPPHMVYDLERATFSNIEHQSIAFVQDSLMPWIVNHEEQIQMDLVEREGYESDVWVEYQVDSRLRGDTLSRYRVYQIGVMYGLLSRNEVRAKENNPAYDGGDEMLMPANLRPMKQVLAEQEEEPVAGDGETRQVRNRPSEQRQDDVQELRDLWAQAAELLQERLEGVVAFETAAMLEALEGKSLTEFVRWLSGFCGEQLPQAFAEALALPVEELAAWTASMVVASLGEEWTTEIAGRIQEHAAEVLEAEANGYAASHRRQLEALIRDEGAAEGEEAARIAVEERLLEWDQNEAQKRGRKAAFESGNAFSVAAMAAVGISMIAWAARGDACKYCRALDGKTVAIGEDFVGAGGTVTSEDGETLQVSGRHGHPPLHGGCDCGVRAVRES